MKLLISGKGGCGKSTLAALLAARAGSRGKQVFVVDADESNIGLYRMLGLEMPIPLMAHLGGKKGFRQKMSGQGTMLGGPPALFPNRMGPDSLPGECVARTGNIRVMSVGKIHHFGEGCACPMGQLFRLLFESLDLSGQDLVIVDTAAGVEHFGRRLDSQVDHVLCVVDPSFESIDMAGRVAALAKEAGLPLSLVLNKTEEAIESQIREALADAPVIGALPNSRDIFLNTLNGNPLDPDIPGVKSILDTLFE